LNWLAHVLLSENHIEHQLGNILADPLKGKAWEGASERIERGIMIHKHIDRFTDAHPLVKKSKALLTPRGHLKGVVLDILYDHFLSLHWNRYSKVSRELFLETFREEALNVVSSYPPEAQNIIRRVVGNRQLGSYIHMDGVVSAFRRIDARLSVRAKGKDNMARYIPLIAEERELLEAHFLVFFPELMLEVKRHCQVEVNHWKI
jgi:acyl carrier protein phosphodiesterase